MTRRLCREVLVPELPSGTVTFLVTDVEGSTALWERQTDAMSVALARHDALIRAAIVEHGGHVVKTMGDAFHAVFRDASDAVAAEQEAHEVELALLGTSLGDEAFAAAWAEGKAMSYEQAAAYALEAPGSA